MPFSVAEKDWLLEKTVLANANDSLLPIPNVLVSSTFPQIPVMNPSSRPLYLRKGELIGSLCDPELYLDHPKSGQHLEQMLTAASKTSLLLGTSREKTSDSKKSDSELVGPKTAEVPDDTIFPADDIENLLDVGSLPDHLKEAAWNMLRKRIRAFSFNGRLGHHPSKVQIRTVPDQPPIAVPMYGTSPAKRIVIEEQLKRWFKQDVIEPSRSPWSAPVVIAY